MLRVRQNVGYTRRGLDDSLSLRSEWFDTRLSLEGSATWGLELPRNASMNVELWGGGLTWRTNAAD